MYRINLLFPASTWSTSLLFPNLEALSHLICVIFGYTQVFLYVISKTWDFLLPACSSDLIISWTLSTLCGKPDQAEKYQLKSKLCGSFVRIIIKTMHLWLMLSTCLVRYIPQYVTYFLKLLWISLFLPPLPFFTYWLQDHLVARVLSWVLCLPGVMEHLWTVFLCEWASQGT